MKIVVVSIFVLIVIQFIKVDKTNPKIDKNLEIKAPLEIEKMLKISCYDCHSNETIYPWYSNIAPLSWFITNHINEGRDSLNFSIWNSYSEKKKEEKLKRIFQTVYVIMPPKSYIYFHKDADLSKEQRKQIRDWTGYRKNK